MKYLILGSGPAGIAAAKAVRGKDIKGEIGIVTEEPGPPYLRPLLTELIMGRADAAGLVDPQALDLPDQGIRIRHGKRVEKIDSAGNRVIFGDGSEEGYDVLLVAAGGKPEIPPALRKPHPAVLPFDSLEDTLRIADTVPRSGTVVVYGPGFLSIVASSAIRKRGNDVVWFQPDLPRSGYPISGELEANILDSVRNTGVRILEGQDIAVLRETGGGLEIESTEKGERVRCLAVVVATERIPAIGFLSGSGVKTNTGIVVDDHFRTSVPNIFAAGDCAELLDEQSRTPRINFGWRSAIKQGRLAGGNMAGALKRYVREESDYFWALFGPALLDRIG